MITIQAQLAKKLPIPGSQFSSQQASITISAEVTDPSQIVAEAARLYTLAEQAVDAQLAGTSAVQPARVAPPVGTSNPPQSPAQRSSASQPYRGGSQQRRAIPPISDAQRRLLDRLLDGDPQRADAVCHRAGVSTIGALNMKQASEAIDALKAQVPA